MFAVTTSLPACIARSRYSRAGSIPPITSTIRSELSRISSKLPRERVSTPPRTGRRPLKRSISPARSSSSVAKAPPTVPWPSSPTVNSGAGISGGPGVRQRILVARDRSSKLSRRTTARASPPPQKITGGRGTPL